MKEAIGFSYIFFLCELDKSLRKWSSFYFEGKKMIFYVVGGWMVLKLFGAIMLE